jgi:hypothetical protein
MKHGNSQKMQLGRRLAYLQKCVKCTELLEQYETELTVRVRVFEAHIQPALMCSYQTFNKMLCERNPQKQIAVVKQKMEGLNMQKEQIANPQQKLF